MFFELMYVIYHYITCTYFTRNRRLSGKTTYLGAWIKNVRKKKERKNLNLFKKLKIKKDVSRRSYGQYLHGEYTSFYILAPRYVVLDFCTEIRRSSSSRRDTSFLIFAPRYVVLHPRAEIRSSSAQPSK